MFLKMPRWGFSWCRDGLPWFLPGRELGGGNCWRRGRRGDPDGIGRVRRFKPEVHVRRGRNVQRASLSNLPVVQRDALVKFAVVNLQNGFAMQRLRIPGEAQRLAHVLYSEPESFGCRRRLDFWPEVGCAGNHEEQAGGQGSGPLRERPCLHARLTAWGLKHWHTTLLQALAVKWKTRSDAFAGSMEESGNPFPGPYQEKNGFWRGGIQQA